MAPSEIFTLPKEMLKTNNIIWGPSMRYCTVTILLNWGSGETVLISFDRRP